MTAPTGNIYDYCCADPAVGGCPHRFVDDHNPDVGHCSAVGCPCPGPQPHTPTCVHTLNLEAGNGEA